MTAFRVLTDDELAATPLTPAEFLDAVAVPSVVGWDDVADLDWAGAWPQAVRDTPLILVDVHLLAAPGPSLAAVVERIAGGEATRLDNPPAVGAPKNWTWGYLPCGCRNDGYGRHVR